MVALKLPTFAGMVPAIDPHLLGEQFASKAVNAWLYSGALAGIPVKEELHTLVNPQAAKAFRIPQNFDDPTYLHSSYWIEFENPDTDLIAAPVAADQYKRFYWTSSTQEPVYNTLPRIIAGLPPFKLGLPEPLGVTVTASGGSSTTMVTRSYITTLVTEYGEEGPASAPFVINGKVDDTYVISVPGVAASDMGTERNVKKIRIYRTIISQTGAADFYMVAELNAQTTTQTYNDTMTDAVLATKIMLESTAWTAPPNLDGFVVMPNGILAGYINNELYFSEPYRPHAWPVAYAIMLEHDIVGLAVTNQTLVVMTKGNPYTASGVNPASITTAQIASFEPCLSKGSILPTEYGVFYTSPNGIILVNPGQAENITKQYITRDKWVAVANRGRVNAGRLGAAYYAFGAGVQKAFDEPGAFQDDMVQQAVSAGASDGFLLDPQNPNVGYVELVDHEDIKSIHNDPFSGEMLICKGGKVYWVDQRIGNEMETYVWKSKVYQTPDLRNFAAFRCYFYDRGLQPTAPQNFDLNQTFDPLNQQVIVRIYADGKLILAHEIRQSGELHRMPSGFKAEFWQVEIEANTGVMSFQMATSVKELSGV